MNGIDKITQRITEDIDREIAGITAQAKEQADGITAEYTARAKREAEEIVARGTAAADERQERLSSMAQMEAKKSLLAVKQEMLGKAFDLALNKLCELPEEEYVKLLTGLITQAAQTGQEEVILSQKDRTRVGKAVIAAANQALGEKGKLTLSEQTRPIRGGLILSDRDVEVNCTFEALVRLQRSEISGEVANILFQ